MSTVNGRIEVYEIKPEPFVRGQLCVVITLIDANGNQIQLRTPAMSDRKQAESVARALVPIFKR